jgi:ferrous iron transport protein A
MGIRQASHLKKGEKAIIEDVNLSEIPLKLIEMGCLPGNTITLIQEAPFGDPLYFDVEDTKLAIRKETANHIFIAPKINE